MCQSHRASGGYGRGSSTAAAEVVGPAVKANEPHTAAKTAQVTVAKSQAAGRQVFFVSTALTPMPPTEGHVSSPNSAACPNSSYKFPGPQVAQWAE